MTCHVFIAISPASAGKFKEGGSVMNGLSCFYCHCLQLENSEQVTMWLGGLLSSTLYYTKISHPCPGQDVDVRHVELVLGELRTSPWWRPGWTCGSAGTAGLQASPPPPAQTTSSRPPQRSWWGGRWYGDHRELNLSTQQLQTPQRPYQTSEWLN